MTNNSTATDACANSQSVQEQTTEHSEQNEVAVAENFGQNEAATANNTRE
jgi:hypothetical protein